MSDDKIKGDGYFNKNPIVENRLDNIFGNKNPENSIQFGDFGPANINNDWIVVSANGKYGGSPGVGAGNWDKAQKEKNKPISTPKRPVNPAPSAAMNKKVVTSTNPAPSAAMNKKVLTSAEINKKIAESKEKVSKDLKDKEEARKNHNNSDKATNTQNGQKNTNSNKSDKKVAVTTNGLFVSKNRWSYIR